MNKAGLIEKVANKTSLKEKEVEKAIDTMIELIIEELLAGRKVNLVGFGSFEAKTRHARGGINPQKPTERITIPEVRVAKFKTGKTLKDALKGKISLPEAKAAATAPVEAAPEEKTAETTN
jgi:DNA-binding protein HU-beta